MALTSSTLERLVEWCGTSDTLADVRATARRDFFGYDEPCQGDYISGAGDVNNRARRFLGWFVFSFSLLDGRRPAELAASSILSEGDLVPALKSVQNARYVMAMVAMVSSGRGIILELENEEFEVDSRQLSRILNKGDALCTHIIPVSRGRWLPGPGWLLWPIGIGPGIRAHLKDFQLNPVDVERFLQQRLKPSEERKKMEYPRDTTLEAAVARMTEAAQAEKRKKLIMPPEDWKRLVLSYITSGDFAGFGKEIVSRVGEVQSVDDLNRWLALAMNIWNTTPQPDRHGKSAYEITRGGDCTSSE